MKKLLAILALFNRVKSFTHWFDIKTTSRQVYSMALAGINSEYVVQGEKSKFLSYTIDWELGAATKVKEVTISPTTYIQFGGRVTSDGKTNAVLAEKTVFRFNVEAGQVANLEEYPVSKGQLFASPISALNTVYVFIAARYAPNTFFYRVHSDRTSDIEQFSPGSASESYGILSGTGWLLISGTTQNHRKLFDYTNGYVGGSNSAVDTHTKTGENYETGFMSPNDHRGYYVVTGRTSRVMYSVKADSGQEHLNYDFLAELPEVVIVVKWVDDTDLCMIAGNSAPILIVDFMDQSKTKASAMTQVQPPSGKKAMTIEVYTDKRAFIALNFSRSS